MTATTPDWPDWLQERLERRGWRQKDLAKHLGYTTPHMSRIATGTRQPTRDACVRIAQIFGEPLETVWQLAGWDIPTNEPPPPNVRNAIEDDPRLTRPQKDILLATYRSWVPDE